MKELYYRLIDFLNITPKSNDSDFLLFVLLFVLTSIIALIILFILFKLPCEYGGIHDWKKINYDTGSFKDSGFTFHYDYNVTYECKKCGKISNE